MAPTDNDERDLPNEELIEDLLDRFVYARDADQGLSFERWAELQPELAGAVDLRRRVEARYEDWERLAAEIGDEEGGEVGETVVMSPSEKPPPRGDWSPRSPLQPGRLIDGYRLLEKLKSGGQGSVWVALDLKLHRKVALKFLHRLASMSMSARKRFEHEAEMTSRLEHPGICTIYGTGSVDDIPYIAMQFVEGESLDVRIRRFSKEGVGSSTFEDFDESASSSKSTARDGASGSRAPSSKAEFREMCDILSSAARALHIAHEAGLVHRDIKPGNIMADEGGQAVVVDFGLAIDEDDSEAEPLTAKGDLLGTLPYMSPEQITAKQLRLDRRTDVYSLGATLFECLTLRRPFEGQGREELLQAILMTQLPHPRRLNRRIPRDLAIIVEKALEKDRNRRYQSAEDFANDLDRFVANEPIQAKPIGAATRSWRFLKAHPVTSASLVTLILTFAAAAWLFRSSWLESENYHRSYLLGKDLPDDARQRFGGARPDRVDEMREWLDFARTLVASRDVTARRLGEVEERMRAADRTTLGLGLEFEAVKSVLSAIRVLDSNEADSPSIHAVEERLAMARSLEKLTVDDYRGQWDEIIEDVAQDERFGGLRLKPQVGLRPLGKNSAGLWEFAHLASGKPPRRDAAGQFVVMPESGLVFILVPGGLVRLGDAASEDPRSGPWTAELDPYFLSKYEMTQAQWKRLTLGDEPSQFRADRPYKRAFEGGGQVDEAYTPTNPVENIGRDLSRDVLDAADLLLPTEAQWENACRAGSSAEIDPTTLTPRSGNLGDLSRARGKLAKFGRSLPFEDGYYHHAPVGLYEPNAWGFYDIIGNVYEWCLDDFVVVAKEVTPRTGLRLGGNSDEGVARGASFMAFAPRIANRPMLPAGSGGSNITGVRPARAVRD